MTCKEGVGIGGNVVYRREMGYVGGIVRGVPRRGLLRGEVR